MYDCARVGVHLEPLGVDGMAFFGVSLAPRLFNISVLLVCYFVKQKIEDRCFSKLRLEVGKAPKFGRIKLISLFLYSVIVIGI